MFRKINKNAEEFEEKFWKSKSAETFYNNLPAEKIIQWLNYLKILCKLLLNQDQEQILVKD